MEQAGKEQGGRADLAAQAASRAERQGARPMWHIGSANTVPQRPGPPSLSKVKQVVARRADSPLYSQGGATPLCRRQPTLHSREPQHRCRAEPTATHGERRGGGGERGEGEGERTLAHNLNFDTRDAPLRPRSPPSLRQPRPGRTLARTSARIGLRVGPRCGGAVSLAAHRRDHTRASGSRAAASPEHKRRSAAHL